MRHALVFGCAVCVAAAAALSPSLSAAEPLRMLMLTQSAGFKHGSVSRPEGKLSPAEVAIKQLGEKTELFRCDCTQDAAADFTRNNLQNYDLVFFYTTGDLPIREADLDYFFSEWLKQKGHGFIGAHSSSDTFHNDKRYWDMIGGTFNGHPWNAGETVTITVHDTSHPAMQPFGAEFQIRDEIYQYKNWQPEKVRVLMSLNMARCPTKKPYHVPVAWVKEYGEGRVFYSNLGHNESTWSNPAVIKSFENGIRWVARLEEGDATPNPELSAAQEAKAKADVAEAEQGFEQIFNGQNLEGWSGDPRFWSVRDAAITGQTTDANKTERNTFLTWKDQTVGDFELRLEYKIVGGNSGIQYRSKQHPDFVVRGYQADFEAGDGYSGILYEEGGRGILATRGQKVAINEKGEKSAESIGDPGELQKAIKKEDWNSYRVIAKGPRLIHEINGKVMVDVTDLQEGKRAESGILALQLHAGPSMTVQFRNIRIQRAK